MIEEKITDLFLQQKAISETITGTAMRHSIATITPTVIATALPTSLEHIEATVAPAIIISQLYHVTI